MAAADHIGEGELIALGIGAAVLYVLWKGGIANAAADAGAAAVNAVVNAAGGAATGAVGAIGEQVGLPMPAQLTDDPYISRWIIDAPRGGQFAASKWSTSSAYLNALTIDAGAGFVPSNSPFWSMFGGETIDMGTNTGGASGHW